MVNYIINYAMHSLQLICLALFLGAIIPFAQGDSCGGLLESDGGEFDLPYDYTVNRDFECVWVIQLLSRQTVRFTLNRLDSSSATVSVYPEHEVSETVLNPIRLSLLDVGAPIDSPGQTLVVILTRSDFSTGLSFTWDSVSSASSDVLTAVNYVDTFSSRVFWNRFQRRERLTWALNLESAQSFQRLALKAETVFERCELLNPCWCSYFGLYEVTADGYLREVTRVCGRSSSFETEELYPKLLAFVYINSTSALPGTDHVELTWTKGNPTSDLPSTEGTFPPSSWPTKMTTEPWMTSTESPPEFTTEFGDDIRILDCGGSINLPLLPEAPFTVLYKHGEAYNNNERCLWTLDTDEGQSGHRHFNVTLQTTLLANGFETCCDGLALFSWNPSPQFIGLLPYLLTTQDSAVLYK